MTFKLYPAIDLKEGKCVRLVRGAMDQATEFNDNPAGQAVLFAEMGFDHLHIVDLDGAFAGESSNGQTVRAIREATDAFIQLGGGIRSIEHIGAWIEAGIDRVILGTIASQEPDLVKSIAKELPYRIAVGVDSVEGNVVVEGWSKSTSISAIDLAKRFEDVGVAAIIATDVTRDGTKEGVNVEYTQELADSVSIPVIASGGLKDNADIVALRNSRGKNQIAGTILGRALYDGQVDTKLALEIANA